MARDWLEHFSIILNRLMASNQFTRRTELNGTRPTLAEAGIDKKLSPAQGTHLSYAVATVLWPHPDKYSQG